MDTTLRWVLSPGIRRFKMMRIIGAAIVDVPGVGRVWYFYDNQTGRRWAKPYVRKEPV